MPSMKFIIWLAALVVSVYFCAIDYALATARSPVYDKYHSCYLFLNKRESMDMAIQSSPVPVPRSMRDGLHTTWNKFWKAHYRNGKDLCFTQLDLQDQDANMALAKKSIRNSFPYMSLARGDLIFTPDHQLGDHIGPLVSVKLDVTLWMFYNWFLQEEVPHYFDVMLDVLHEYWNFITDFDQLSAVVAEHYFALLRHFVRNIRFYCIVCFLGVLLMELASMWEFELSRRASRSRFPPTTTTDPNDPRIARFPDGSPIIIDIVDGNGRVCEAYIMNTPPTPTAATATTTIFASMMGDSCYTMILHILYLLAKAKKDVESGELEEEHL